MARNNDIVFGEGGHALLIKLANAGQVAREQGGALAGLMASVAPMTIESEVYKGLASQLQSALADKGISAQATVVDPAGYKPIKSDWLRDIAIGLCGAAAFELVRFGIKKYRGRR